MENGLDHGRRAVPTGGVLPVLLLWLVLLPRLVVAVAVDLDEVTLPVPDRSLEARRAAIPRGLEILLVRLTGERDVARFAGMEALLAHPERYLQQFAYETAPDAKQAPSLRLRMRFDRDGILRVLRRHGLPVWPAQRPAVVAWIAIDNGRQRFLLGDAPESRSVQALKQAAERRGIPMLLPLMDLQDRRAVRFADVWGGFLERLERASQRYDDRAVLLVGRIHRGAAGGWRGDWKLRMDDGSLLEWNLSSPRLADMLVEAVDAAADRLALRLAIRASGSREWIRLTVEGVRDLSSHLAVRRALASLAPVQTLQVRTLAPDEVGFALEVEGGRKALERALNRLDGIEVVTSGPPLRLRWLAGAAEAP